MPGKQRPKVYLAGPEVFLRNAVEAGAIKVELCGRYGLEGKYPLDAQLDLGDLALAERAYAIFRANEGLIMECDAVIANLTPFRGPGMDTGTAYEVGFVRGKGKPVFGYSNHHLSFFDRVRKFDPKPLKKTGRRGRDDGIRRQRPDGRRAVRARRKPDDRSCHPRQRRHNYPGANEGA